MFFRDKELFSLLIFPRYKIRVIFQLGFSLILVLGVIIPAVVFPQIQLLMYRLNSNGRPEVIICGRYNDFNDPLMAGNLSLVTNSIMVELNQIIDPIYDRKVEFWSIDSGLVMNGSLSSISIKLLVYPDDFFETFNVSSLLGDMPQNDNEVILIQPSVESSFHRFEESLIDSNQTVHFSTINRNLSLSISGVWNYNYNENSPSFDLDSTAYEYLPLEIYSSQKSSYLGIESNQIFFIGMSLSQFERITVIEDFVNSNINPVFYNYLWINHFDVLFNKNLDTKLKAVNENLMLLSTDGFSVTASMIYLNTKNQLGSDISTIRVVLSLVALLFQIGGVILFYFLSTELKLLIEKNSELFIKRGLDDNILTKYFLIGSVIILLVGNILAFIVSMALFPLTILITNVSYLIDNKNMLITGDYLYWWFMNIYMKNIISSILIAIVISFFILYMVTNEEQEESLENLTYSDSTLSYRRKISVKIFLFLSSLVLLLSIFDELDIVSLDNYSAQTLFLIVTILILGFFNSFENVVYFINKIHGSLAKLSIKHSFIHKIYYANRLLIGKMGNIKKIISIIIFFLVLLNSFVLVSTNFLDRHKIVGLYANGASVYIKDDNVLSLSTSNTVTNVVSSLELAEQPVIVPVIKARLLINNIIWHFIAINASDYLSLNKLDMDIYPSVYNSMFDQLSRDFENNTIIVSKHISNEMELSFGDKITLNYHSNSNFSFVEKREMTIIGMVDNWPGLPLDVTISNDLSGLPIGIVTLSTMRMILDRILRPDIRYLSSGYYLCFSKVPDFKLITRMKDMIYNSCGFTISSYWDYLDLPFVLSLDFMIRSVTHAINLPKPASKRDWLGKVVRWQCEQRAD